MQTSPVILIVDDEPDIVETLDFALRRKGYEVRVAYDGEAALESARSHKHDPTPISDQEKIAQESKPVWDRVFDH